MSNNDSNNSSSSRKTTSEKYGDGVVIENTLYQNNPGKRFGSGSFDANRMNAAADKVSKLMFDLRVEFQPGAGGGFMLALIPSVDGIGHVQAIGFRTPVFAKIGDDEIHMSALSDGGREAFVGVANNIFDDYVQKTVAGKHDDIRKGRIFPLALAAHLAGENEVLRGAVATTRDEIIAASNDDVGMDFERIFAALDKLNGAAAAEVAASIARKNAEMAKEPETNPDTKH